MSGTMKIDVLKTGAGHSTITFDTSKPEEVENARLMIEDMMKLGYTFYVDTSEGQKKVTAFDPKTGTYKCGGKGEAQQEVSASTTTPTAVAPTSGGCLLPTPSEF